MPEVMEAPAAVESSVSSGNSDTGESTESTGSEETSSAVESGQEAGGETQVLAGKFDASSFMKDPAKREALKAIDPALVGKIRDWANGEQALKKEFPGGFKEAVQYRDVVKQNGGVQGIQEQKQYLDNYDSLDTAYTEGKPEFIQRIADGDPEAFEKMVPLAIEHFSKQNPEGYQHIMSKVLVNTLDAAQFPQLLQELYKGATDEAKPLLEKLWNKIEGYRELSAKIPERKVDPNAEKLTQREQEIEKKQSDFVQKQVNTQSAKYRDLVIARELKPFAKWDEMDDDRKAAIVREVRVRTGALVNGDESFKNQRSRLLASGDAEGVIQLEKDFLDQHLPTIIPKVARFFSYNPGKKVAPSDKDAKPAVKAPQGFTMVPKMPDASQIKRGFGGTNRDMLMNNQAILNDGRKVQWA